MKKIILLFAGIFILSYSCSNGGGSSSSDGGGGGTTPDTTAPTLSSSVPTDTATGIATNANISLTFSEKMSGVTVTSDSSCTGSVQLSKDDFTTCVAGAITSSDDITYEFNPSADFDASTEYKVKILADAKDAAGNPMTEKTISFTTGAAADTTAPTFAGATGATADSSSAITISWSTASDDTTASGSIVYDIYQATTSGGQSYTTATATSVAGATSHQITGLSASTAYYFVVRARDAAGNRDTNTTEVNATTDAAPDTTAPAWENSTPSIANLADTSVDLNVQIDEAGTVYYIVIENGGTGPTAADVKAGLDYTGATVVKEGNSSVGASSNHTFNITGLAAGTEYDIYAVAEDDEGTPNLQGSASTKIDITTTGGGSSLSVGDLVISEVMANPSTPTDSDGEYIEIYNASGSAIDFSANNITIDDGGTPQTISSGNIASGGYFLLCNDTNSGTNGGITNCDATLNFALTNSGETLTVKEGATTIDSFTYNADAGNGISWQLATNKLNATDNDNLDYWGTGTSTYGDGDNGTPRAANDFTYYPAPAKGEILIVEIGNAIKSTTENDYILLYNNSANDISLNGFYIGRDSGCDISGGSWTKFDPLGNVVMPSRTYYLIARDSNTISADFTWDGALSDGYCVVITNDSTKPTTKSSSNVYDFVTISGGFSNDDFYKRKGSCQHQYTGIDDVANDFDTGQDGSSHTPLNASSAACTP